MSAPLWVIMVPTIPKRAAKFRNLMTGDRGDLLGQVTAWNEGSVEQVRVLAWLNEGQPHLGAIRDAMVDEAAAMGAEYVSFVDDDDRLMPEYVSSIIGALYQHLGVADDWPDHVGFRVEMTKDGEPYADVDHSLMYGSAWRSLPRDPERPDIRQFVRDFTHLDPIRTELAQRGSFALAPAGQMEDRNWVRQVRPFVKTEAYIDRVLYHYDWRPDESAWETPGAARGDWSWGARPTSWLHEIQSEHLYWHPESM